MYASLVKEYANSVHDKYDQTFSLKPSLKLIKTQ